MNTSQTRSRARRAAARGAAPSRRKSVAGTLDTLVVLNPAAPRNQSGEVRKAIEKALRARNLRFRIAVTPREDAREEVQRQVSRALAEGCRRIIAAGGDGTASLVAACLPGHSAGSARATLAIIPAGTANVLARELGIPLAIDPALLLAVEGEHAIEIDAILTADRPVFTQIGIGPDAQMIRDTSRESQIRLGRLAYLLSVFRRTSRHRAHWFDLEVDGKPLRVRALQIVLANVGMAGASPFTWGPGIDPTDGTLDLCIFNVRTLRDYLAVVWRVMSGGHRRDANTRFLRAQEQVTVRSESPILVQGDGEVLGKTPVTFRVAPRALRIFVPRDIEGVESTVGSPAELPSAGGPTIADVTPTANATDESIAEDVDTMLAEHSRTWVLQGVLRHPLAALSALDAALFLRINGLPLGSILDRAMVTISRFMHFGEGWAVVALVMLVTDFRSGLRVTAMALPTLWLTTLTVNYPLKKLFRRRRPFIAFVKARVIGRRPLDYSLPSGHTAAAFAGALLFGFHAPGWSPLFYALALMVGFSRIYLGVHYPSDVMVGAIVGTLLAATYRAILLGLVPALR